MAAQYLLQQLGYTFFTDLKFLELVQSGVAEGGSEGERSLPLPFPDRAKGSDKYPFISIEIPTYGK